jgi:hypothetical protein
MSACCLTRSANDPASAMVGKWKMENGKWKTGVLGEFG